MIDNKNQCYHYLRGCNAASYEAIQDGKTMLGCYNYGVGKSNKCWQNEAMVTEERIENKAW